MGPYRDELVAAHARIAALEGEAAKIREALSSRAPRRMSFGWLQVDVLGAMIVQVGAIVAWSSKQALGPVWVCLMVSTCLFGRGVSLWARSKAGVP